MKKLVIFLTFLVLTIFVKGQSPLGVEIENDSVNCCRTLEKTTADNDIVNVPVLYSAQFVFVKLSGYPKFRFAVLGSLNGTEYEEIYQSDTITEDNRTFVDNVWDTLISIPTVDAVALTYMGIRTELIDSTQALEQHHDLIITTPNLFLIAQ